LKIDDLDNTRLERRKLLRVRREFETEERDLVQTQILKIEEMR
jgi:hypothetical protein